MYDNMPDTPVGMRLIQTNSEYKNGLVWFGRGSEEGDGIFLACLSFLLRHIHITLISLIVEVQ